MTTNPESKSFSHRSAWVFVLVGVLAGVSVGGGVGVIAASSTKSVTVCANKKTNVLRYAKNGMCIETETLVVLNQTGLTGKTGKAGKTGKTGAFGSAGTAGAKGDAGAAGTNGTNGAAGAKGDTGATGSAAGAAGAAGARGEAGEAGAMGETGAAGTNGTNGAAGARGETGAAGTNGTNGAAGARGETGAAGTNGTNGAAGAQGDAGVAGTNGTNGVNGAAGASSPTGFTARSVCGASGTTLCAVGVQGPGGGVIVYVDTTNEMPGYDYLEVAPADAPNSVMWSTTTAKCGTGAITSCQTAFLSDAGTALDFIGLGTGRAATAAIVARHNAGSVAKGSYAAGVADTYTTTTASDWFLPSKDELNEVCKYARDTGQAAGAGTICAGGTLRTGVGGFASTLPYWSSSEFDTASLAWNHYLTNPALNVDNKSSSRYVRPVRAF